MDTKGLKFFKYEIALGSAMPMPKPALDLFPYEQNSVQQFLYTVGKKQIGALYKQDGKWHLREEGKDSYLLTKRPDICEILDYAAELSIIVASDSPEPPGTPVSFKLSERYWTKFDQYAG
jgi:hypothetical protein